MARKAALYSLMVIFTMTLEVSSTREVREADVEEKWMLRRRARIAKSVSVNESFEVTKYFGLRRH